MATPDHKVVVLTRTHDANEAWRTRLNRQGFVVYCLEAIQTIPVPQDADSIIMLRELQHFDWLILTSAASVRYISQIIGTEKLSTGGLQIAAIGQQTARAAQRAGLIVSFRSASADSETLAHTLHPVRNKRILYPHTTIASRTLENILRARGAAVTSIPLYETRILDTPDTRLSNLLLHDGVRAIIFASPSAVAGFCASLPVAALDAARFLPAVAIGPRVARVAAERGFQRIYTSDEPSVEGILHVLCQVT